MIFLYAMLIFDRAFRFSDILPRFICVDFQSAAFSVYFSCRYAIFSRRDDAD